MKNKIVNNIEQVVDDINNLSQWGITAQADEADVRVHIVGTRQWIWDGAKLIETLGITSVGDGDKEGKIFVNGKELSEVINWF
jgi:hypothetical protein